MLAKGPFFVKGNHVFGNGNCFFGIIAISDAKRQFGKFYLNVFDGFAIMEFGFVWFVDQFDGNYRFVGYRNHKTKFESVIGTFNGVFTGLIHIWQRGSIKHIESDGHFVWSAVIIIINDFGAA